MPFFVHCPAWWEGLEGLVESTVHPWIIQCVTAVGQWDFKPRWTQSLQEFPLIPGPISAFPVNPCITKSCLQKCPNTGHGQIPPFLSQLLSMPNSECCMIVCTSQHTQLLYTKYYLYKTRRQAFFRWQITVCVWANCRKEILTHHAVKGLPCRLVSTYQSIIPLLLGGSTTVVCICALPLLSWRKDVIVVECNPPNNPSLRFVWNCTVVSASPIPSSLVRPPLLSSPLPSRFVLLPPVLSLLPLWPCPLPSPSRDVLRACYSLLPIVLMCCSASASMLTSSKSWSATRALRSVAYLSLAKLPGVEVQLSALVRKECLHCRVLKERVREVSNWVFERFGSIYIYMVRTQEEGTWT